MWPSTEASGRLERRRAQPLQNMPGIVRPPEAATLVRTSMFLRSAVFVICMAAICIALSGCAKPPAHLAPNRALYWPKPPETKRIRFVGTVSEPADLNIQTGAFGRLFRYLVGTPKAAIVSPYGVAADSSGRLYVVDRFLNRVHVFDPSENAYSYFPEDPGVLKAPVDIALDAGDRIYVTDARQAVVKVFAEAGKKLVTEIGVDLFKRPTGIAVNRHTEELVVVDTLVSRVFRFDLSNFSQKGAFGGNGSADGQFHYPTNICVTPEGRLVVADSLNFRVQVFAPDGRFLHKFGRMGHSAGSFSRPKGVAADSDGNIYVVDALFDNVQIFDPKGRLLMAFGNHGTGAGEFWLPTGMYIDANDRIYVSDASNSRIQVFEYLKRDDEE